MLNTSNPNITMPQYNTQSYQKKTQTPKQSKIRSSISNFRKKILFQQNLYQPGQNYSTNNNIPKRSNTRPYIKGKLNSSNLIRVEDENSTTLLPSTNPQVISDHAILLGDQTAQLNQ